MVYRTAFTVMETTITTGQLISRLVVCVCLRTGCTVYTVVVCFCVRPWGDIYACINGLILGKSWLSKLKFMPTLTSPSSLDPILLLVVFWLDGNAKKSRIVFKLQHLGLKRVVWLLHKRYLFFLSAFIQQISFSAVSQQQDPVHVAPNWEWVCLHMDPPYLM